MKKILFSLILCSSSLVFGQKVLKLFQDQNYEEITKLEKEASNLSGEELYYLGYAFFMMENDAKAIEYYDKSLEKKFDNPIVYFQKGYAQMFLKQYDKALANINIAISKAPKSEFYVEKANIFKYQKDTVNEDKTYEEGLKNGDKESEWYLNLSKNAGNFYYVTKKDYKRAQEVYASAITLFPEDYALYEKLMKAFNAEGKFSEANVIFAKMKEFYTQKKLPEDFMKFKNVSIDEFAWNNQFVNVFKYFEKPQQTLESLYTVYLIDKTGDKIERKFNIEKTIQIEKNDPEYLICEETKNGHSTYHIGFKDDTFTLETLRTMIRKVLDENPKTAASVQLNNSK